MITKIIKFIKDWPLLFIATSFLVGFSLTTYFEQNLVDCFLIILIISSFLGFFKDFKRISLILVSFVAIFLTASLITNIKTYTISETETKLEGIEGVTISQPKKTKNGYSVNFNINLEGNTIKAKAFYRDTDLKYGDKVKISGKTQPPNNEFPNKKYIYSNQVAVVVYAQKIEKTGYSKNTNFLVKNLYTLRSKIVEWSARIFPYRSAGIINAMIFGDTTLIGTETEEIFLKTGTTHLLVVSGANVLMIAWILKALLNPFGANFARIINILIILSFIIFTGAEPSIVRAGLIFILITFAEILGRKPHYPTLLATIACTMAIFNPWIILYNVTFQLSFGAVLGLTVFSKKIESFIRIPILKETLAPTIAASIFTLPLIIFHFSQLSTVFLVANILAVPLVPFITVAGLTAMTIPFLPAIAAIADGIVLILIKTLTPLAELKFSLILFQNELLAFAITCFALLLVVTLIIKLPDRSYEKI